MRNPELMAQVQKELRENPGVDPLLLQAAIKETNRFYTGVAMVRLAQKTTVLPSTNHKVHKNTLVAISPYLTHHDPANYPDPDKWLPQRFMGDNGELVSIDNKGPDGVKWLAFGHGVHRCVGEKMAWILSINSLKTLLTDYDFEWSRPDQAQTTDWSNLEFTRLGSPWLKTPVDIKIRKHIP